MNITQLKSTCCSAPIYRYGGKRRQCRHCKRTWSIRPKKRGPKRRIYREKKDDSTLNRYLVNYFGSLLAVATEHEVSPSTLQRRVVRSRARLPHEYSTLDSSSIYILLADALTQTIQGKPYTTYLILARAASQSTAQVAHVHTTAGHESGIQWQKAYTALPDSLRAQVKALVCDGHPGLTRLASLHGWVLQRCCFHVVQSVNKNMRLWHRATADVYYVHELIHTVLESADDVRVIAAMDMLLTYAEKHSATEIASIIRGLSQQFRHCRSYIYYPELHLPATNNACESSFRRVRALQSKARGWRTPTSHTQWVHCVLLSAKDVRCLEGETRW
jgi:hypothetical protein